VASINTYCEGSRLKWFVQLNDVLTDVIAVTPSKILRAAIQPFVEVSALISDKRPTAHT
jgi:hypothetical protein